MQSADISLDTAVLLIDNLNKFFSQFKEDGFEKPVTDARLLANECFILQMRSLDSLTKRLKSLLVV